MGKWVSRIAAATLAVLVGVAVLTALVLSVVGFVHMLVQVFTR
jgi:hypothetical protein